MRPLMLAHAALLTSRSMYTQPAAAIAQLGGRQTEDLKVPGSIPGLGMSSLGPEEVKWLDFQGSTLYPRSADAIYSFCYWQKKIVTRRDSSAGRASD